MMRDSEEVLVIIGPAVIAFALLRFVVASRTAKTAWAEETAAVSSGATIFVMNEATIAVEHVTTWQWQFRCGGGKKAPSRHFLCGLAGMPR